MTKITQTLKNISGNFRHTASCYPLTLALVILASVFAAVFIDQSGTIGKFMEDYGIQFTILWGIGTFFTETLFAKKKAPGWIAAAGCGVIAALLMYFTHNGTDLGRETAGHWTAAYVIVLISCGVYLNFKRSGLPFNEFCIRVVYELSRTAVVCAIASIGIAMVMGIFVTLILNGEHYMLILRSEFLVIGCLLGIGLLSAQISLDQELPRFYLVIIKYLLMSLLLAAFLIIYGYILKIIITRVVPSNEIFRILAGLFIIGLPIWTLIGTFPEDHPLVRIGVKLPYIFIPFLFLQGYAIRERILAYGITPLRYLCLVLMLFEVLTIAVYAVRKRETGIMLPVIAVLAVISLVVPYVNMYSTSNRSQKAIFDRFITAGFNTLSREDQSSLAGSYYYLAGDEEGKLMIADIPQEKRDAIEASGLTGNMDYDQSLYIYYEFPAKDLDISGFERMTAVSTFVFGKETEPLESYDPEAVRLYDSEGEPAVTANISEFVNRCISAHAMDPLGSPDFPGMIVLPDGSSLCVQHISMTIEQDQTLKYLDLSGILLK